VLRVNLPSAVVGRACVTLDVTGAASPLSALANGIASFEMTLMNETGTRPRTCPAPGQGHRESPQENRKHGPPS